MTREPGICTIFQGAGAPSIFGTPCGRQLASGSSFECEPSVRWSYSALAHGWNGTCSGFRSAAMLRTYLFSFGSQMPDRSGLPSRVRGAGAERFTFPSVVRGMPVVGSFVHWPHSGAASRHTAAPAAWISFTLTGRMDPRNLRRLYTGI